METEGFTFWWSKGEGKKEGGVLLGYFPLSPRSSGKFYRRGWGGGEKLHLYKSE